MTWHELLLVVLGGWLASSFLLAFAIGRALRTPSRGRRSPGRRKTVST